jgi:hypothetical protein
VLSIAPPFVRQMGAENVKNVNKNNALQAVRRSLV